MYKSDKIITTIVLGVIGVAVLAALAMWVMYYASLDPNAVYDTRTGELTWNDTHYVEVSGDYSALTKTLARIDGDVRVMELAEDPDHNFVAVVTWDETFLMVRDDYAVSASGDVTAFLWNEKYITDEAACAALEEVLGSIETTFTFETDNVHGVSDTQRLRPLYVSYDGCPVATDRIDFMGTVDGRLMVTSEPVTYPINPDGSYATRTIACYEIPEEQAAILLPYLT